MINLVVYILKTTSIDFKLLFNGDVLIFQKINKEVFVNIESGFWEFLELDELFKGITYSV